MKSTLFTLFCFAAGFANAAGPKPNIVLFVVDDMGWQDTSVPFWGEPTPLNKKFHMPSMERLAADGIKFTQAYATAVCSPTRVSMMTGYNAARHRVTNWTLFQNVSNDANPPRLQPLKLNNHGLQPKPGVSNSVAAKWLPEYLRQAGYHTIHVGEAHLGAIGTPGDDPRNPGFDVNIAGHAAGFQRGQRSWRCPPCARRQSTCRSLPPRG